MVSFNRVVLGGNLTRDPEMRFTQAGVPVCSFGIAVNWVTTACPPTPTEPNTREVPSADSGG